MDAMRNLKRYHAGKKEDEKKRVKLRVEFFTLDASTRSETGKSNARKT